MPKTMTTSALLAALAAEGHTLRRCRDGFKDPRHPAAIHSRRTANAMVVNGDARYDDANCPASLTLTAQGLQRARQLGGNQVAA